MKPIRTTRRHFLKTTAALGAAAALAPALTRATEAAAAPKFKISLAQWSLHRRLFRRGGTEALDNLDFAATARDLGFGGVEYVNLFFRDRAGDAAYLAEMNRRAADAGVENLLIMVDGEGDIGAPEEAQRARTVENHLKWLDAAKTLGCHSIRVNAASDGRLPWDEQARLAADGFRRLCVEGAARGLYVLVENHGGLSSHGKWLTQVARLADHPRGGILPDFGNFYTNRGRGEKYNPYLGMREFMPWARRAVSAKSYDWDTGAGRFYTEDRRPGYEITLDFERMVRIVVAAGYSGYIGVEYEGHRHSEMDGVRRTKQALEDIRAML